MTLTISHGECSIEDTVADNSETINGLLQKLQLSEKKLKIAVNALNDTQGLALSINLAGLDYDSRHKMYDIMFEYGIIDTALKRIKEVK